MCTSSVSHIIPSITLDTGISTQTLIAQTAGGLTHKRYLHAIVFVDHYSDLSYLHLLKTQSGEEVLEAKEAFETYASSFGIDVRHYHADNGIFNARAWRTSCSESHQGLSFAGVNAHHQNGELSVGYGPYRIWHGQCLYMPTIDGQKQSQPTSGLMQFERRTIA